MNSITFMWLLYLVLEVRGEFLGVAPGTHPELRVAVEVYEPLHRLGVGHDEVCHSLDLDLRESFRAAVLV